MTKRQTAYRSIVGVAVATAFILLLPLLAMQFSDEVVWGAGRFRYRWRAKAGNSSAWRARAVR